MFTRSTASLALTTSLTIAACGGASKTHPTTRDVARTTQAAPAASTARETQEITLGTLTFDVITAGPKEGVPVILLHGFPETAREWTRQIDALTAAGYRVIAPNQRGYSEGARPAEVSAYALPALVGDVLGIADALGAERFHLVGHDWGAAVAWATAGAAPTRILTLNNVSIAHPDAYARSAEDPNSCQAKASSYISLFRSPAAEQFMLANGAANLRASYEHLPREVADEYVAFFSGPALTGGLNWYRANVGPDVPRAALGPISVPTMFVWSDGDAYACRDGAELTREYVTGPYRFEVLEGVSHWVPEVAAERLNALLLEHLAAHARKS